MKLKGKVVTLNISYVFTFVLWTHWLLFTFFDSHWSRHTPEGKALESDWNATFAAYEKKYPEEAAELKSIITGELPAGWEKALPVS